MSAQPHPFLVWGQPLFGGGMHTAADVWTAPGTFVTFAEPQVITSPVLPGFSSALRVFFDGE